MNVALTGLPLSGKTCLFDALAGGGVDSTAHPARPDRPNRASVAVPDPRRDWLAEHYETRKVTPVHMEVLDLPGLAVGRSDLAAQNTAITEHLRRADALAYVLRAFENPRAPHPRGRIDPPADRDILFGEFLIQDLDTTLRRIEKLAKAVQKPTPEREARRRELELLERIREALESEQPIQDVARSEAERTMLRGFAFLTLKPTLSVINVGEDDASDPAAAAARWPDIPEPRVALAASIESEIARLPAEEREPFLEDMGLARLHVGDVCRTVYRALDRITFYTVGEKEVAARSVPRGATAVEAAGEVHTDMARGFIRAEVIPYDHLREAGSAKDARAAGHYRVEGRDYVVQDGDILLFHFSR